MQSLTAPVANPSDDLDAVLGRFQAWSASCGSGDKTGEMIDGVRELSYEEALQSSRHRWQAHTSAPASCPAEKRPANEVPSKEDAIAPDSVTLSTNARRDVNAGSPPREAIEASFGNILTEAVSPDVGHGPLALIWPGAARSDRQVSMSLRVTASEQALIKARAAEAGLSVSAYLRQCTLEVEKLRAQVHHTLARLEEKAALPYAPPPAHSQRRGLLSGLRQRLFGRPVPLTLRA
jgi:hypothetical protein